jgi:hypothetical protein
MKKFTVLALLLASGFAQAQSTASKPAASASTASASASASVPAPALPSSPAKKELVARVLVLEQGAIEQTAQAMVERPAIQLQQQAAMALQNRVPPEKREAAAKLVQADLKKYVDEVGATVRQQAIKLAPSTVGALLEERFTEAELKELISIIESPVNRKFTQMGAELQKSLGEKLVAQTQATVAPKVKALEQSVIAHLGLPPAPAVAASGPGMKAPKK